MFQVYYIHNIARCCCRRRCGRLPQQVPVFCEPTQWSQQCRGIFLSPNESLIPHDIVSLDLSTSVLEKIEINFFRYCSNLISLDISLMRFMDYSEGAFSDLVNLKTLRITPNIYIFEADYDNMGQLLISKQMWTLDDMAVYFNVYRDSRFFPWNGHKSALKLFMNFFSQFPILLETLATNVLDDDRFALAFTRFQNLSTLHLCGEIPRITNITFKPLLELPIKILKTEFRNLEQIGLGAFEWFPNLRELHMDGTVLSGINVMDIMHPVFFGLYNSKLEKLSMQYLIDRRRPLNLVNLTRITGNYLNGKALIYLTHLYLNETNLADFDFTYYFAMMPNLQILSLAKNLLSPIKMSSLGSAIETLERLQYLDVSYQQPASMELNDTSHIDLESYSVHFSASANLEVLDLSGLSGYTRFFVCKYLVMKVTPNLKHIIFKDTFLTMNIIAPNADLSVKVDLSTEGADVPGGRIPRVLAVNIDNGNNQIPFVMTIDSRSYLRYLSCSVKVNRIKESPLSDSLLNSTRKHNSTDIAEIDIDLSKNRLNFFNKEFLGADSATPDTDLNSRNVNGLNLSDNALGSHFKNASDLGLFSKLINLLELDLSFNDVTYLPEQVFAQQSKLKSLKLNTNFLQLIEFQISHMHDLQYLDLSQNLISQMGSTLLNDIDGLKSKSPNFTINLKGNPIQCSCDTFQFLQWLHDRHRTKNMFQDFDQYSCVYSEKIYTFENVAEVLDKLHFQCLQDLIIKVTASVGSFLIFVAAFSVFLYRHRWDIRFFCIKFVSKRNAYHELEEFSIAYDYDAFVAYHRDDSNWVRNELNKNLGSPENDIEENFPTKFKFCIHERDFVPGNTIEDSIVRAIERSRKTILVLSGNFLASGWCEFELQMACMESVRKRTNLIIAVMLEPLSARNMSRSFQLLIRRNTYIEWSENPREKERFWEKMSTALKPSSEDIFECDCGNVINHRSNSLV